MAHPISSDFLTLQTALAGRYSLERELGRGGMGIVYLAYEVALDRPVALKLLPAEMSADEEVRQRFLQEARTAASGRAARFHAIRPRPRGDFLLDQTPAFDTTNEARAEGGWR